MMPRRRPLVGSAIALAMLGFLAALAAWRLGAPAGLLVAWFAAACFIVAAAYAFNWPGVFGKTTKAPVRLVQQLVLLPYLAFTRLVWHLMRLLSSEAPWNPLVDGVRIGRRPLRREVPGDVDLVVDLTAELPKAASAASYLCVPILAAGVPDAPSVVRAINAVSSAHRVFIHCAQGHGRTALFASCVLIHRGYSAQAAVDTVLAARPGARMNGVQRAFVEDFASLRQP
jgi:hypothetical protein